MTKHVIGRFFIVIVFFSLLIFVLVSTGTTLSPIAPDTAEPQPDASDNNGQTPYLPISLISIPSDMLNGGSLEENGESAGGADLVVESSSLIPSFQPYSIESTIPDLMIASTAIMSNGQIVSEYTSHMPIDFTYGSKYTEIAGITTFRGNNFRDSASFGFADLQHMKFGESWFRTTGNYIATDESYWSGHGWTGQPLVVQWPRVTRNIMNMHDWAKDQEELVEVIYPAMDGYIYFTELETGKPTRENLYLGYTFKGTGAIDPRGYPMLYVGAGFEGASGAPGIFIISLVDGSILYSFGNGDAFAPRAWYAADSSPLIDAETDNLIYPSENGILYIIRLNSQFDQDAGTMIITPDQPVKWRYNGRRSHVNGKFWLGMETSPVAWRGYLFIADNGGHLLCLNLNTLELAWVRDILDDTNCSPVLELEDGHPYLYISTSFHADWRSPADSAATVPIWKIDGATGETVWQVDYVCRTMADVSGGVQGTAALGKFDLSDIVYVPVARTPTGYAGVLAAISKRTGETIWEFSAGYYSWSSPVCFYDQNEKGYVIYCTADGNVFLLDGLSGESLDSIYLGGLLEASPVVYENTLVIGTRVMRIWGIALT